MLLRRWREFGVESRRTSTLARDERILRSHSEEPFANAAATPPTLSPSVEARQDKPTLSRSRNMSQESGTQPTFGVPNLSTPYSNTPTFTPAGTHEIQQPVDTHSVSSAEQPIWGTTPYGPPLSNFDRNFRSGSPGLFQQYGPSPTAYGPTYTSNPTWGTGVTTQPTQENLMRLWQVAHGISNNNICKTQNFVPTDQ